MSLIPWGAGVAALMLLSSISPTGVAVENPSNESISSDNIVAEGRDNTITVGSSSQSVSAPAVVEADHPRYEAPGPVEAVKPWNPCTPARHEVSIGSLTKSHGRVCEPVTAQAPAEAGEPVVVTSSDVSTLLIGGSGLVRQPPGDQVIITKDLIVYTDPSTRTLTTTVGGTVVTISATPVSYTWHWGDGTSTTTTDPGRPYPNQSVVHRYHKRESNVVVSLTTTWTATYTINSDNVTRPVTGTITTTESSTPFTLIHLVSILTDDAEEAQGH